ncbi:MAG: ywdH [Bacteroidetes bacterium]|nr:ywdH [Bacteroidota bacterium]
MNNQEIVDLFLSQREFYLKDNTLSLDFRLNSLKRLKEEIIKSQDEIAKALFFDLHKSYAEAYLTEIGFVIKEINHAIKNLKKWAKDKRVSPSLLTFPSKGYIQNIPLGQVLIISPWNYPFQLAISPLVGAISAGNTAIIKPAELSPNTSKVIKSIIEKVFPSNYISTVIGGKEENLSLLDLDFNHIFFTGSPVLGKIVMEKASKNLVPITLELGGKSPCIVDKTSDLELSAKRIVFGKFLNSGQTCIAPDYILVDKQVKDKLIECLINSINCLYNDSQNADDYGRIISESHFDRLVSMLMDGKILYGGSISREEKYISPTLITDIHSNSNLLSQEIFGPILPIIAYEDLDIMLEELRRKPKPLALYIFSKNKSTQNKILSKISSGGVCINDTIMHITPDNLPFGGVGNSGMGSYHGKKSFETFSHQRSVLDRKTYLDIPLRYPPFTQTTKKIVKKIM